VAKRADVPLTLREQAASSTVRGFIRGRALPIEIRIFTVKAVSGTTRVARDR